jgi:acetyl-CoA carboxylase biotin carboxyl carrier protein
MEMDKIRELIQLVQDSGIQEIEISQRGETIRISKAASAVETVPAAPVVAVPVPAVESSAPTTSPEPSNSGLAEITSPIVGTFYGAPSPESAPFVELGQRVTAGDVLCIVEAMKVMNEIESDVSGVVREINISNGQPVEFGQVLFRVDAG